MQIVVRTWLKDFNMFGWKVFLNYIAQCELFLVHKSKSLVDQLNRLSKIIYSWLVIKNKFYFNEHDPGSIKYCKLKNNSNCIF